MKKSLARVAFFNLVTFFKKVAFFLLKVFTKGVNGGYNSGVSGEKW